MLAQLIASSSSTFLQVLFQERLAAAGLDADQQQQQQQQHVITKKNERTIALQFRDSLASLCTTLKQSSPHFVRCVKSNNFNMPGQYVHTHTYTYIQRLTPCVVAGSTTCW